MKEELIRVEHGRFQGVDEEYCFDISVSRGECIGIYVDDHLTSGTAYLDIFKGYSRFKGGKAFSCGERVNGQTLERWIRQKSAIADKHRFESKELMVRDYLMSLGKTADRRRRKTVKCRLESEEAADMMRQMKLDLPADMGLSEVSLLDYYSLSVFRAWLWESELLILDRLTEVLREKDLEKLMRCVQLLQEHGTAVLLFDLNEMFMYRYTDRIDVIKDRKTSYRLYPEEYGEKLYAILGWKYHSGEVRQTGQYQGEAPVLQVSDMTFPGIQPLNFQICRGEIAFLRDENYSTSVHLRKCFLGETRWQKGVFWLDGSRYAHGELGKLIGTEIGLQLERPDRANGVVFDNLTALDNLSICMLPKAKKRFVAKRLKENILTEATRWFDRDAMQRPLRTWPLPERLRFSYYKWYLLNPKLLICFFPFAGQETAYHEMIIDMLVLCAERGMAVWVVSSGIDAICEKTENREFLRRLRYLT